MLTNHQLSLSLRSPLKTQDAAQIEYAAVEEAIAPDAQAETEISAEVESPVELAQAPVGASCVCCGSC